MHADADAHRIVDWVTRAKIFGCELGEDLALLGYGRRFVEWHEQQRAMEGRFDLLHGFTDFRIVVESKCRANRFGKLRTP
jgi:hypothetical protein